MSEDHVRAAAAAATVFKLHGSTWPELLPLPSVTEPVPAMPERLLPEPLRPWLADASERASVPLEFIAAPALVSLGAVIGRAVGLHPKRRDDWRVTPNLWGALVGRPGTLKSAAVTEALRPLRRLASNARQQHEGQASAAEARKVTIEARRAAAEEKARAAAKKNDAAGIADAEREIAALVSEAQEAQSTERRYYTQDATIEKLGALLQHNERGLLVVRDELAGWLRLLERPGREGEREFFLEGWNGVGDFTFDRIGRGTVHIPNLTLSVLGTIQPGKLTRYIGDALAAGAGDDGLLQRFQVLVWPDGRAEWRNVDRWPDSAARDRAFNVFSRLDGLQPQQLGIPEVPAGEIPALRFAADAQELFDAWRAELERRLADPALAAQPAFESHLCKYRSLMPQLALLLHLVAVVDGADAGAVTLTAARSAASMCEFFEAHARKLYAAELRRDVQAAHALAARIRAGAVQDGTTLRDIQRKEWSGLREGEKVSAAVEVLTGIHWVKRERKDTGGAPSEVLRINPRLAGSP